MWRLLRRIRSALAVAFLPGDRMPVTLHDFHASMDEVRREHRLLVQELEAVCEKLSMAYARDARRKARQLKKGLGGDDQQSLPLGAKDRKAELRRKVAGVRGIALHRGPDPGPPPDDEDDEP